MDRTTRILVSALVAVAIAAAAFSGGVVFGSLRPVGGVSAVASQLSAGGTPKSDLVKAVEETRKIIESTALHPSSDGSMTRGAINGMVMSLNDKYAAYFDPKHYQYFSEQNAGQFFGIGVTVSDKDGAPVVISVIKDTPAANAGLKPGDVFVSVNGVSRTKWTSEEIVKLVRGPKDTTVKLGMRRKGVTSLMFFTMKREKISFPNVMSEMMGKDVGYIRVGQFNALAAQDIAKALGELGSKGAKGYVIDLRENPGGLLDSAVDVVSLFVPTGAVVRIEARNKPEEVQYATGASVSGSPLVILVDEHSASASEIVAAALQDYGRATVVGNTTFGKGSVQTIKELSYGGAIKLTTAHYLSPKSRVIDKKGVKPDVLVKMDPANQNPRSKDTQLKKALEVLRAKIASTGH
jgi:carboxyl-terminal processing protease